MKCLLNVIILVGNATKYPGLDEVVIRDSLYPFKIPVLRCHWNRHHVDEVNSIVSRINSNKADAINDIDTLTSELEKIKLSNPSGSLACRIQFINRHCDAEQLENTNQPIMG